jgi:hypothetical protein
MMAGVGREENGGEPWGYDTFVMVPRPGWEGVDWAALAAGSMGARVARAGWDPDPVCVEWETGDGGVVFIATGRRPARRGDPKEGDT